MNDEPVTQQTPSEAPLANDPTARNPDGSLKDAASTTNTTSSESPSKETPKEEAKAEGEKKLEAVPEKYELKAPEGFKLSDEVVAKASETFKELGLSQAQADKLMEIYGGEIKRIAEGPMQQYEATRTEWRNSVISDPVLGDGKGDLKADVKATIGRAIDGMGTKEAAAFREIVELTGVGDNPAFIRGILAIAKSATEGRPVTGAGPSKEGQRAPGSPKTGAQALYPNLPSSNG